MLVVKTLELREEAANASPALNRLSFDGFTVEHLQLKYGTSLAGIRYQDVHINVDPSKRHSEYDALIKAHQAHGDLYGTMRKTDERNSRLAQPAPKTRTTEEMRDYLSELNGKEGGDDNGEQTQL
jgi:hypothetical protein